MKIENQFQGNSNMDSSKYLGSNLLGSLLILLVSLTMTIWIILPDVEASLGLAVQTHGVMQWLYALEGMFVTGFLIVFPLYLVIQAILHFRRSG